MLSKLVHHEFKNTARYFVPMYICFLAVTLLLKISGTFNIGNSAAFTLESRNKIFEIIDGLLVISYFLIIMAIFVLTFFIILRRFYTNMFGDEGYLMFTLPVKTSQLINSKLICAFIWQFFMIPAILLSFLILFANTGMFSALPGLFRQMTEEIRILHISGFHIGLLAVELCIGLILQLLANILTCYLSMTLGQYFWPQHRLLSSILAYLGINIAESFLSSLLMLAIGATTPEIRSVQELFHYLNVTFPVFLISSFLLTALYYLAIHYFLDKKLNLN